MGTSFALLVCKSPEKQSRGPRLCGRSTTMGEEKLILFALQRTTSTEFDVYIDIERDVKCEGGLRALRTTARKSLYFP